jgi:two-component system NtrC family sensor kinase
LLARWPIRNKLLFGLGLMLVSVATLSGTGFHGLYAYRGLVKSLGRRAAELPLAANLDHSVAELRLTQRDARSHVSWPAAEWSLEAKQSQRDGFRHNLAVVNEALRLYTLQLADSAERNPRLGDAERAREWESVKQIEASLERIAAIGEEDLWLDEEVSAAKLDGELAKLQQLTVELPSFLHSEIRHVADDVRGQYRTLIGLSWATSIAAAIMLGSLVHLFYKWVFRPLRILIKGSRKVASGQFSFRIQLDARDEMAELAQAMNDMTSRFQAIRDDLDRQVQVRTKQVVRSEQMASVGFLAAGVAHEINNPLAAIAMSAESLERRIRDFQFASGEQQDLVQRYLAMIQSEAFRCKEITEKLLDFSRSGEVQRRRTELRELVQGVIDMASHLDRYRGKTVVLQEGSPVLAVVNAQEIKQVTLNLIANALDSLDEGGRLTVSVETVRDQVRLVFTDTGCGMTPEVLEHLFEPFFTRRKGGQGTGLGLSITYRIIQEHQGQIEATSAGPGQGSRFVVTLPLGLTEKEPSHRYHQAA